MSAKHTPGPWVVHEREVLEDASVYPMHITGGAADFQVCLMESTHGAHLRTTDEAWKLQAANSFTDANARLIAAAPDLLAFAQSLIDDYCSDDGMASAKHIVKLAQEVVAKATGGEA